MGRGYGDLKNMAVDNIPRPVDKFVTDVDNRLGGVNSCLWISVWKLWISSENVDKSGNKRPETGDRIT